VSVGKKKQRKKRQGGTGDRIGALTRVKWQLSHPGKMKKAPKGEKRGRVWSRGSA